MVAALITYAHDKRRFNLTKTSLEFDGYDGTFLDLYKHNDLAQLTAPEIVKEFFHDTGKCSNFLIVLKSNHIHCVYYFRYWLHGLDRNKYSEWNEGRRVAMGKLGLSRRLSACGNR